jgi:hypothetical protein
MASEGLARRPLPRIGLSLRSVPLRTAFVRQRSRGPGVGATTSTRLACCLVRRTFSKSSPPRLTRGMALAGAPRCGLVPYLVCGSDGAPRPIVPSNPGSGVSRGWSGAFGPYPGQAPRSNAANLQHGKLGRATLKSASGKQSRPPASQAQPLSCLFLGNRLTFVRDPHSFGRAIARWPKMWKATTRVMERAEDACQPIE